jgi:hypothetical protein
VSLKKACEKMIYSFFHRPFVCLIVSFCGFDFGFTMIYAAPGSTASMISWPECSSTVAPAVLFPMVTGLAGARWIPLAAVSAGAFALSSTVGEAGFAAVVSFTAGVTGAAGAAALVSALVSAALDSAGALACAERAA